MVFNPKSGDYILIQENLDPCWWDGGVERSHSREQGLKLATSVRHAEPRGFLYTKVHKVYTRATHIPGYRWHLCTLDTHPNPWHRTAHSGHKPPSPESIYHSLDQVAANVASLAAFPFSLHASFPAASSHTPNSTAPAFPSAPHPSS